ncbi:MAG: AIR synthase-related protein [Ardenticatenia bacterium]|nr:AIR synthase-related protein [Ardenticatenia bacterium]
MLGTVPREQLITPDRARPGDRVVLVRGFPIEGTAILARERADELRRRGYDEATLRAAQRFLYDPGISVVTAARTMVRAGPVHALHDPTEGGVATGVLELAMATGLGIEVDAAALSPLPLGRRLCAEFGLDPLGTIASGALLAAVPPEAVNTHLQVLTTADIPAAEVGKLLPAGDGYWLRSGGKRRPLPRFTADEIVRLFG